MTEKHDGVPLYHPYQRPVGIQINQPVIANEIHLQFDKISVGTGDNKHTFDLVKIFKALDHIADVSKMVEQKDRK